MSRVCQSCGLRSCDSIECYLAEPEDIEVEVPVARPKYVPSAEYLAWCAQVDAEQLTDIEHLGPGRIAA